jgi:hypothetical protein
MKKFFKIILLIMSIAIIAASFSACAGGGAAVDAEGEWEDFTWSYKKDTKTLTITGAGDMPDADSSADVPWASVRASVEEVRLRGDGAPVTSVGDYAFYGMTKLEDVELDKNVKSIGKCAFAFCPALKDVTLEEGLENIGESAFEGCAVLVEIEIPASVTTIEPRVFAFCRELNVVTIKGKPARLSEWLFKECTELDTVIMNLDGVAISDSAFEGANIGNSDIKSLEASRVSIICEDADGVEIHVEPGVAALEVGVSKVIEAPEVSGYKTVGETSKTIVGTGEEITVKFSYEKLAEEEPGKTPAEPEATEPVVKDEEDDDSNVMTIVAIVIFAVVIVAIVIGAILLIRSDKRTTKDSMTVRKNKDGKGKKK